MISMITKKQHDHNDQQDQKDHNDKHCLRNMMVINITMIIMIHNYQVHNDHNNQDHQVHNNLHNHVPKIHHNHCDYNVYYNHVLKT